MTHASFKAALFLSAGLVIGVSGGHQHVARYGALAGVHTKVLLYLSGLGAHMPLLGVMLLLFTLANLSFPLFPNFVAELLCLVSLFAVHELLAYVYCVSQVLGAAYGFWALNKVVHGVSLDTGVGNMRCVVEHGESLDTGVLERHRRMTVGNMRGVVEHGESLDTGVLERQTGMERSRAWVRQGVDMSRVEWWLVMPLLVSMMWLGT